MLRILYGPTASGKSSAALSWAVQGHGAVINADALQIYDALPILTAQPDASERVQAPHKLYGCVDPQTTMNAAQWAAMAALEIVQHEHAVLVGGTGLYITTLLDGIAPIPAIAPETRARVSALYDDSGPDAFQETLRAVDPDSAARVHKNRREQMIRALEIHEGTGVTMSEWHARTRTRFLPENVALKLALLLPDKQTVQQNAARRFDTMLHQGVLDEVKQFGDIYGDSVPAAKALGFKALWTHVQGEMSLEDAKDQYLRDTNAFIKRQFTWGRQQLAPRANAVVCTRLDEVANALA